MRTTQRIYTAGCSSDNSSSPREPSTGPPLEGSTREVPEPGGINMQRAQRSHAPATSAGVSVCVVALVIAAALGACAAPNAEGGGGRAGIALANPTDEATSTLSPTPTSSPTSSPTPSASPTATPTNQTAVNQPPGNPAPATPLPATPTPPTPPPPTPPPPTPPPPTNNWPYDSVAGYDSRTFALNCTEYVFVLDDDVDPDGDFLFLTAVGSGGSFGTTTMGGTVQITTHPQRPGRDVVLYSPPWNLGGADDFWYQVEDGRGGYAVVTVYMNMDSARSC